MKNIFFLAIILTTIFHELLMAYHNCPEEYFECFNCTTCGESEENYEDCYCQWDINTQSCKIISEIPPINNIYQAFTRCEDPSSKEIQDIYCGSKYKILGEKLDFSLPLIYNSYGARSIYCEYIFTPSNDETIYYNLDYKFNSQYDDLDSSVSQLYIEVKFNDYSTSYKNLERYSVNKDIFNVKEIIFKLYFEQSFPTLPFSLVITEKNTNSKMALYITIGIIILACVVCALSIYCLSKKVSENARLRQRALFAIAMAHQQGAEEVDDEDAKQEKLEMENNLKINFALKHALNWKKFKKELGLKDGNTCTICIEEFKENKSKVSVTPCKHVFHYKCLSNWLRKNVKNPKCPNCNYNLIQDVKDIDIYPTKINPERIQVKKPTINNVRVDNNNSNTNRTNENRIIIGNIENSRNVQNDETNTNTEERNLRTSANQLNNTRRNNINNN